MGSGLAASPSFGGLKLFRTANPSSTIRASCWSLSPSSDMVVASGALMGEMIVDGLVLMREEGGGDG